MSTRWNRRDFIKETSAASMAALAAGAPMAGFLSTCNRPQLTATADTVI
jgi:hypothetical protein